MDSCPKIAVVHNGHVVGTGRYPVKIFQNPCHVTAAKLSGCKNISRIKRIGENRVYALDWNTELVTAESVGDEVRYILESGRMICSRSMMEHIRKI